MVVLTRLAIPAMLCLSIYRRFAVAPAPAPKLVPFSAFLEALGKTYRQKGAAAPSPHTVLTPSPGENGLETFDVFSLWSFFIHTLAPLLILSLP